MMRVRKLEIIFAHKGAHVFCRREIHQKYEATSHLYGKNLFCNATLLPLVQKVEVAALLSRDTRA